MEADIQDPCHEPHSLSFYDKWHRLIHKSEKSLTIYSIERIDDLESDSCNIKNSNTNNNSIGINSANMSPIENNSNNNGNTNTNSNGNTNSNNNGKGKKVGEPASSSKTHLKKEFSISIDDDIFQDEIKDDFSCSTVGGFVISPPPLLPFPGMNGEGGRGRRYPIRERRVFSPRSYSESFVPSVIHSYDYEDELDLLVVLAKGAAYFFQNRTGALVRKVCLEKKFFDEDWTQSLYVDRNVLLHLGKDDRSYYFCNIYKLVEGCDEGISLDEKKKKLREKPMDIPGDDLE